LLGGPETVRCGELLRAMSADDHETSQFSVGSGRGKHALLQAASAPPSRASDIQRQAKPGSAAESAAATARRQADIPPTVASQASVEPATYILAPLTTASKAGDEHTNQDNYNSATSNASSNAASAAALAGQRKADGSKHSTAPGESSESALAVHMVPPPGVEQLADSPGAPGENVAARIQPGAAAAASTVATEPLPAACVRGEQGVRMSGRTPAVSSHGGSDAEGMSPLSGDDPNSHDEDHNSRSEDQVKQHINLDADTDAAVSSEEAPVSALSDSLPVHGHVHAHASSSSGGGGADRGG